MLQKKVLKQTIIWSWSPLKKKKKSKLPIGLKKKPAIIIISKFCIFVIRMKTNYISNKRAVVKNCHIHKKYEADVVGSWTRI